MRCLLSLPADDPIRQVAVRSRQEDSHRIQYAGDNVNLFGVPTMRLCNTAIVR